MRFRCLPLRGEFYFQEFLAQTIKKFPINKWEHMQTICKFSKNMLLKSQKSKQRIVRGYKSDAFVAYLLRGYFYCRTNLAFSIRYISEIHLQESRKITSCQDGTKRNREWYGSNWPIPNRKSSIHSAYAHRPRPHRKSLWKEAQHRLRYGQGQERGRLENAPPYGIGLCPIL